MKIFVYGTLKSGYSNNFFMDGQKLEGSFETEPEYTLYRVASFPGLVKAEINGISVKGEVWDVDEICLQRLDSFEGHPGLFKRQKINIKGLSNEEVMAYLWNGDTEDLTPIGNEFKQQPHRNYFRN